MWRLALTRLGSCLPVGSTVYSHPNATSSLNISRLSISMDTAISCIPVFPEEFTLAQLPFFSEDYVYDTLSMPYTPSSVCKACWKGPFAKNLGLSPKRRQWYPPWPEKNSYSTSRRKLRSRADAGCVWCRFVLRKVREAYRRFGKRLIVSLRSDAREWFNHSGWPSWRHSHRPLVVDINGVYGFYRFNFFSTAPGASENIRVFSSRVPGH